MKKTILKTTLITVCLTSLALFAGDYVVIVNPANAMGSISKGELKRLYTGKMKEVDGKKAVPVNMNYDTPTAEEFLSEVTGKDPSKYKKFWVDQMIKGNGTAPMIKPNSAAVKAIVSQIPGAVGYVPAADVDATVKSITLN